MTLRDLRVLEFLNEFKLARTSVLADLFFDGNLRVAQRRLKVMTDEEKINHMHAGEYIFYSKLPTQFLHSLALTDYIAYLSKKYKMDLDAAKAEYTCGKTRADALIVLSGKPCFVEVQLTDAADISKYLTLKVSREWESSFNVFPSIRVLSNIPPNKFGLDVVVDDPRNCVRLITAK